MTIKACWWCRHFTYTQAEAGWGEYTPGTSWDMSCDKKVWSFDPEVDNQEKFGMCLSSAENCEHFRSIK